MPEPIGSGVTPPGPQLVLLSDQPVGDGQEDLLSSSPAAHRLAALIRASRAAAPFALAVYADWGMGKSSMLKQVKAAVEQDDPEVRTVWFNAWTASRADALEALIKSVLAQLDPSTLRRMARRFDGESALGAWTRVLARGAAGVFRLHPLVDEIWKQLSIDAQARNKARDQLTKELRRWSGGDGRTPGGRMIVVFVDDLDRCAPEVIGVVCDAVKQYLSVPGLVFVLGCDRSVIELSVGAAGSQVTAAAGRRYLEKIIQASYSIPVPTDEQAAALVAGYARRSGTEKLFQGAVAQAVIRHAGRNPRRIKRLINRFVIEYRLDAEWLHFGADALIRVILLQDLYPEFYSLFARVDDLDPIDDFLGYLDLRAFAGAQLDAARREKAERFLAQHEVTDQHLAEAGVTDALVARVERELPEEYVRYAADKTLASLVRELAESTENAELRAKLRRRHVEAAVAPEEPDALAPDDVPLYRREYSSYDTDLSGLHILWIYNRPVEQESAGRYVERRGARVTWVDNGEEAVRTLAGGLTPAVVVSNLGRAYSRDGGFDDLVRVRSEGGYSGPLIVYTSYVSPARTLRAGETGARITARLAELLGWLQELAEAGSGPVTRSDRRTRKPAGTGAD